MRFGVREYERDVNGQKVKVSQHTKNGKGARPKKGKKSLARRGWGNVVNAWRAGRKKKKWTAAAFALLATVELSAFLLLQTTSFALVTLAVTAGAVALVANLAAGGKGFK